MKTEENVMDERAGAELRRQRTALGLSQETVGKAIGCTFQQVQKYERGINRISISKLVIIERETGISADDIINHARGEGFVKKDVSPLLKSSINLVLDFLGSRKTLEDLRGGVERIINGRPA